jgi:CBS domain-containing protein
MRLDPGQCEAEPDRRNLNSWRHTRKDWLMNREMAEIIRNQKPLTLKPDATVREACQHMHDRRVGAVLITNEKGNVLGIFTGRDAVRILAREEHAATLPLAHVMTRKPACLPPRHTAIDALRLMRDGGFRHVPVVENGVLVGVVSRGDFRGLEQDRLDEETGLWERIG